MQLDPKAIDLDDLASRMQNLIGSMIPRDGAYLSFSCIPEWTHMGKNPDKIIMTKYNFDFPEDVINKNIIRLTNQLWKLIPMRENNEDWEKQLNTVIIEVVGLKEIFVLSPFFLQLLIKLEGLKIQKDINFELYRKTVFESINIL